MSNKKPTKGQLIAELSRLRLKITDAGKVVDALKAERDTVEIQLMDLLDKEGTVGTSTTTHTATITEEIVPTVVDWDAFYTFMRKHNKMYLLQRRPASTGYRDELDARDGKPIPGVESFKKRGISLRKKPNS